MPGLLRKIVCAKLLSDRRERGLTMAETYKCKYLTGKRLKIFLAVADRIVPPDEDSPGAGTLQTAGIVDWSMGRLQKSLRSQLMMLLYLIEFMGVFFGGKPFTGNSDAARDRELRFFESAPVSRLRLGFLGLKSYACMGYYAREDVWKTFDYGGPMLPDKPFADPVIRALCKCETEVEA